MTHYRRDTTEGGTWFFTVVTYKRRKFLCDEPVRAALRDAIKRVQLNYPFTIDAWVLLPDHFHCVWTLPDDDSNFQLRMRLIKTFVTRACRGIVHKDYLNSPSRKKRKESSLWQRRYWEHRIRDDKDYMNHLDYLHYNPVKHGLCKTPIDWHFSTLHRLTQKGAYPKKWACDEASLEGNFGDT